MQIKHVIKINRYCNIIRLIGLVVVHIAETICFVINIHSLNNLKNVYFSKRTVRNIIKCKMVTMKHIQFNNIIWNVPLIKYVYVYLTIFFFRNMRLKNFRDN